MKNALLLSIALALIACNGKKNTTPEKKVEKKEPVSEPVTKAPAKTPKDSLTIQGDLGTIDRAMVQKKFEEAKSTIDQCIYKGVGQDAFIGGNMDFVFRINLDGTVKRLDYSSTVGSWEVEQCIYSFAKGLKFIKPKGGEAKVRYGYGFSESMEIKKKWGETQVSPALRKIKRRLTKCSDGTEAAPSTYKLVFYVLPDGELGQVGISSGKELPSKKFYGCVMKALKKAKFKDPMGTVAKVTVTYAP